MKRKKQTTILLCISILLCVISMIGTNLMQSNFGKTDVFTYTGTLSEVADMIRENNTKTGKDIEVTFEENNVYDFSFMTMIPSNASAETPVPAIICCHGGANTKEMQLNGYLELARRGFVVIAMDMAGHGYSDNAIDSLTSQSLGMIAATEYAMSLECVDETQIGVTGHSMGNQACYYTIASLNQADSDQRIAAWVEGAGSMYAVQMTEELSQGLIWTMSVDKYDEFDTQFFSAANILETDLGKSVLKIYYPEFDEDVIPEGQWYCADGKIDAPQEGQALSVDRAFCMYNPPITHPMFHFSKTGTKITINGFYQAFGTPQGAEYISADHQVWPIAVCFECIGLLGFFMLLFPVVALVADTKFFTGIKRKVDSETNLPSIKEPKEWILLAITLVILICFSFFSYVRLYPLGDRYLDPSVYAANDVPNGIGLWTMVCGIFTVVMIFANYFVKKILYRKSNSLSNPFESAYLDSGLQMLKTIGFSAVVVILMFIPVYVARYVFQADFRICSFIVTAVQLDKLPLIVFKYVPLWLVFYIPNAIMNVNTRYKEIPEWLSVLICAVTNGLGLIVFLVKQYTTLFMTGALWNPTCGMAGIVGFAIVPCLLYAAISARYIYRKTGNVWAAGMINGTLMCCLTLFCTRYYTDFMLTF